jgi:uncharacterized membrane protein YphA (DoxX/SURF4 family)
MKKRIESTIIGRSFPLNLISVIAQFIGCSLITSSLFFNAFSLAFLIGGITLVLTSFIILLVFKGYRMMALLARVLLGSYSLFSGMLKANDPYGYAQKWTRLLQDDVFAFQLKSIPGFSDFSLAYLSDYTIGIIVVVLLLELIIGVLLIIGGLPKLTAWFIIIPLFFTTLFAVQMARTNEKTSYVVHQLVSVNSPEGKAFLLKQIPKKSQKSFKKSACFDVPTVKMALNTNEFSFAATSIKGTYGKSLSNSQSLLIYFTLFYFSCWFFAARNTILPNSIRENWVIIPLILLLFGIFSFLLQWYFLLFFVSLMLVGALWIYRSAGKDFATHYGSSLFVLMVSLLLLSFTLNYEPFKDFKAFAVGNNLNLQIREKVFEDGSKVVAIDTLVFRPTQSVSNLAVSDRSVPFIQEQMAARKKQVVLFPFLCAAPTVNCLVIKQLDKLNENQLDDMRQLLMNAKQTTTVLLTANSPKTAREFCNRNGFKTPVFFESTSELNEIARTNAVLLVLKKGIIKGKFITGSFPKWSWINSKLLIEKP